MVTTEINTICAISTPPGVGGIAVVRLSGPEALKIADRIWIGKTLSNVQSHTAHLGSVKSVDDNVLDQCVATVFHGPGSFTGEDIVEFSVHGSVYVQAEILRSLAKAGARLAEPGEFTRRAFTSGKIDLVQAEAIADLISSQSKASHRIAMTQMRGRVSEKLSSLRDKLIDLGALLELELDFSEEEVEFASRTKLIELAVEVEHEVSRLLNTFETGTAIKNGIPVAIIGDTNAGKSSLLNALLEEEKAIVSDIHGTTRDIVEDTLTIGDNMFRFMDTAGLRETEDPVEKIGIERSYKALNHARIVLLVLDVTEIKDLDNPKSSLPHFANALNAAIETHVPLIVVLNKIDLVSSPHDETANKIMHLNLFPKTTPIICLSAKTGDGMVNLKETIDLTIKKELGTDSVEGDILITNARHAESLKSALLSSRAVIASLKANLPGDLIAQDLRETLHHLSSITGDIPNDLLLSTIFSRFCVGK